MTVHESNGRNQDTVQLPLLRGYRYTACVLIALLTQVVEREQALGAATRQLDLTRHSLEEQLLAAEEKLAVRSRKASLGGTVVR